MTDSTDNARGPELIWWNAAPMPHSYTSTVQFAGGVEYIRADLAPDALSDPRVVALVEALRQIKMAKFEDGTWQCVAKRQADIARAALSPTGGNDE